ncbi:glycoside hydrolase family 3 protein [Aeromicrobium sp. Marseille-Q0843]|uniref:Glycoside hydrolase family 3 protein n=1 Tax=Aeromicrobium phoceense TaxID=2754045 RepID=A0A838XH73_9ACTN|nr:glycoside hydrolase family 3 N-terminal domain-containing protein [Aeromicrobium phoceense]MBA4609197.1 glycoside hydrolase family 3 protein [Aeromicrobium phoceense]
MTDDSVRADAHGVMLAAFHGPRVPSWLAEAFADGLAGICLYGDNLPADGDVRPVARAVAALDPTRILALDEEGGDVTRLHMATGSAHPGNAALGVVDDVALTRTIAAGIGAELREAGVWLDLAPCADANSNAANPVIGTRSFGADPALVARHVAAFVEGLASAGVAASVKHFPGHGDTSADSHLELPRVDASAAVLRERELVPFRAAIEARAASIMTSHVVLAAFDPDRPATLSRAVLTGLLRDELGYDGVIVSDALDMAGASGPLGLGGAAVASLAAGADLLCLGPESSAEPRALTEAVEAVVAAVGAGTLERSRLRDAAVRVERLRADWSGRPAPEPGTIETARTASEKVAAEVVARLGVTPLTGRATVVRIDTGTNPAVGWTDWGRLDVDADVVDLTARDLEGVGPFGGEVLVVARRAAAHPEVRDWVTAQLDANPQARLVELAWPDPRFADRSDVLCTMGSSAALLTALSRALRGDNS